MTGRLTEICLLGFCMAVLPCVAAELQLVIRDSRTQNTVPARVRVRDASGQDHLPPDCQPVRIGKDQWFVSSGRTLLSVPVGKIEVRVERGTEYSPIKEAFEVADGSLAVHEITLNRWINMRERGYVCGENHLHVPAEQLGPQLAAEGLDFGNSLQWWNGPKYEVPSGEGFIRDLTFAGWEAPTSIYDVEIEHAWGAAYLIGMPRKLEDPPQGDRPNLPIVRRAHEAGALVCYQGGYSREALVDALLGCVDVINVCNNNFHRHCFQPRSRYSNMLNVEGLPAYPDTAEGMMQLNTDSYYRLLNCGLRLAAGAESATGAKRTPAGYNRTYVRTGEKPSLPEFLAAWRQGRNFVTCGPMLFLRVNGKQEPGDAIALTSATETLQIEAEAIADQPITSLQVVVNGQVVEATPTTNGKTARLSAKVPITTGSWIAARCAEEDRLLSDAELSAYTLGGKQSEEPTRLRYAHTSPVYVTVQGTGPRVAASVAEAEKMLDAFERFASQGAAEDYKADIQEAVKTARRVLAASADQPNKH